VASTIAAHQHAMAPTSTKYNNSFSPLLFIFQQQNTRNKKKKEESNCYMGVAASCG
jgi:hypothetical protein